jgi:hypothetical protein
LGLNHASLERSWAEFRAVPLLSSLYFKYREIIFMDWVWIAGILILLAAASGMLIYLWRFLRLADIVPRYIRANWQQTDDGLLVLGR